MSDICFKILQPNNNTNNNNNKKMCVCVCERGTERQSIVDRDTHDKKQTNTEAHREKGVCKQEQEVNNC